ncbi:MAG: FHA domain-containing protein [Pseudomonadota bacterium]|nr:FHA domain-containing protein [Pseudomonadota bacterium]
METLALIEALDRDGHPRQILRVAQWPVRIGRAIDCDLVLDDPHVAALHATLDWCEDGLRVQPAATVNGVRLGASVVAPGSSPLMPPSGILVMGATTLRVRLAGDVLSPEQRLVDFHKVERRHAIQLAALIALAAVWQGFVQWLTTIPGTPGSALAMSYLSKPALLVLWCAAWAIGSMLFQHRFAFWAHLRVALSWLLLGALTEAATAQIAFALSMPVFEKFGRVVFVAAIAMMIWRHMGLLLPQRRRAFAIAIAGAVAVGGALMLIGRSVGQEPLVGDLYLGTISLPGVRVVKPVSTDAFVKSAAPLEKTLSRWAKPGDNDDDEPSGEED